MRGKAGPLGVIALCAALVVLTPSTSAQLALPVTPVFHEHAPFNGTSSDSGTSFIASQCTKDHYVVHTAPGFDETTGKLLGNSSIVGQVPAGSAPGTTCGSEGIFGDHLSFTFTSTVGGLHAIRADWDLDWWAGLTAITPTNGVALNASAGTDFWIHEQLIDNTTRVQVGQVYYNWSNRVDGGNSTVLNLTGRLPVSFPTRVALTKGDHYWIVLSMAARGIEFANGTGSFAKATMSFKYQDHESTLVAVRIG